MSETQHYTLLTTFALMGRQIDKQSSLHRKPTICHGRSIPLIKIYVIKGFKSNHSEIVSSVNDTFQSCSKYILSLFPDKVKLVSIY